MITLLLIICSFLIGRYIGKDPSQSISPQESQLTNNCQNEQYSNLKNQLLSSSSTKERAALAEKLFLLLLSELGLKSLGEDIKIISKEEIKELRVKPSVQIKTKEKVVIKEVIKYRDRIAKKLRKPFLKTLSSKEVDNYLKSSHLLVKKSELTKGKRTFRLKHHFKDSSRETLTIVNKLKFSTDKLFYSGDFKVTLKNDDTGQSIKENFTGPNLRVFKNKNSPGVIHFHLYNKFETYLVRIYEKKGPKVISGQVYIKTGTSPGYEFYATLYEFLD